MELENKLGGRIVSERKMMMVSERKRIEDELNNVEVDIKNVMTGSGLSGHLVKPLPLSAGGRRGFTRCPENSNFVCFAWFWEIITVKPPTQIQEQPLK